MSLRATHDETCSSQESLKLPSDTRFLLMLGILFTLIGVVPSVVFHEAPRWWALVVALLSFCFAFVAPTLIHPVKIGWFTILEFSNGILSFWVLLLLFYGLFTPVGLLFRVFKLDALRLKRDSSASSYWIQCSEHSTFSDMQRQF
jgi:hypothetical protein